MTNNNPKITPTRAIISVSKIATRIIIDFLIPIATSTPNSKFRSSANIRTVPNRLNVRILYKIINTNVPPARSTSISCLSSGSICCQFITSNCELSNCSLILFSVFSHSSFLGPIIALVAM